MNETLQQIINACVPILCLLISAGGAYLVALLRRQTSQLQQELNNDMANQYIEMAYDAVEQAVTFTAQTFVDALKSENAFTKERQIEAFNIAKNKVLDILGETTVGFLYQLYGDFDAWLDTRIEQVCREIKQPEAGPSVLMIGAGEAEAPVTEPAEWPVPPDPEAPQSDE